MQYLDFELEIGPGSGGDYPVSIIHSPAGEARGTLHLPFNQLELRDRLQGIEMALLRSAVARRRIVPREELQVQTFGAELYDALLGGELRAVFDVSREQAAARHLGLRLKLRLQPPELASLPWEYLYDRREQEYLALARGTPVVRYLELPYPNDPLIITPPLRILGLVASPQDQETLDVAREQERINAAVQDLERSGRATLTWVEGETWRDLQRAMRHGPWHVFHFIGHGAFDPTTDEGFIALADEQGNSDMLSATQLGRLLADHFSLRLVVLNSCEGARGSSQDVFSSTAAVLLRRGIPAILAMQYEISDKAAIEFTRAFYEAIGDGTPLDGAVGEARIAVSLALKNTLEWGVPVLHMRSPDGRVFEVGERTETPAHPDRPPEREAVPGSGTGGDAADRQLLARGNKPGGANAPAANVAQRPGVAVGVRLRSALRSRAGLVSAVGVVLIVALVVALVATTVLHRPGGQRRDGVSGDGVSGGGVNVLWQFRTGGFIGSSPIVAGGRVFFGSQNQDVYALDAASGVERWRFETGKIVFSSPVVADGVLYVGSNDGNLYALNEANGKERWRFGTEGPVQSTPAVHGGLVFMASYDGKVYALDAATGHERWRFETGQPVFSSPVVAGGTIYVGSKDHNVYALDATTGQKRWRFTTGAEVWSTPAVSSGTVYVGSNDHNLYALDASTGAERWRFTTKALISSSPFVADGTVYVGSFDHNVYAIEARTGRQRWHFTTGDSVFSSPTAADGVVYVGSHDHRLYAIDARSGTERWHFDTGKLVGSSPQVAGGIVYVGSDDGSLYAIEA
jgi:outer membrane protein assembly factor BamB